MYRLQPTPVPPFDALIDERDHLQVKISLAADAPCADPNELHALSERLAQVESEIAAYRRRA